MNKPPRSISLGARERQILDVLFSLGEGSVGEVHERLADTPSYSAVRTMIRSLETKGLLQHRRDGIKYVYRPKQTKQAASKLAIKHLIETFFCGSTIDAALALLKSAKLTDCELDQIEVFVQRQRPQPEPSKRNRNF